MAQKILIIEDDVVLAETLQSILDDTHQYETAVANGGEAGLKLAEEFKPDLIILDLLMAGKTGMDLLAAWHESGLVQRVPITIATNLDQLQIINRAIELGARNYFLKSEMSPEAIIQHCQAVLAGTPAPLPPAA